MTIALIIAAIIALPFVLALFIKKEYSLKREIMIQQPVGVVFDYLKHIKNQDYFNRWVQIDPDMKKEFKGADGNVGFIYAWDGNKKAGEGEMEIKNIVQDKQIDVEIRFVRPIAGVSQTPLTTEKVSENVTKVSWAMSSRMKYPMNFVLLFLSMDKLLGKELELSLEMLKKELEAK